MNALAARDADAATCMVGGVPVIMDLCGALFLPGEQVLIVSDMHLEKGTSWARRGVFLPPYDSKRTFASLQSAVRTYRPRVLVFLGDSFHDKGSHGRLQDDILQDLRDMCARLDAYWITGNHDPEIPESLPGQSCSELAIGGIRLVHIPSGEMSGDAEISGHLHPAATVYGAGRSVKRRCFATDGKRMILPAFGAYTGGLNVRDRAFAGLFEKHALVAHVIGENRIYSLPLIALAG